MLVKMLGNAIVHKRVGKKEAGGKTYTVTYSADDYYEMTEEEFKLIGKSGVKAEDKHFMTGSLGGAKKLDKKMKAEAEAQGKENAARIKQFESRARGFAEKETKESKAKTEKAGK